MDNEKAKYLDKHIKAHEKRVSNSKGKNRKRQQRETCKPREQSKE